MRLLIVDDNSVNRRIFFRSRDDVGHEPHSRGRWRQSTREGIASSFTRPTLAIEAKFDRTGSAVLRGEVLEVGKKLLDRFHGDRVVR